LLESFPVNILERIEVILDRGRSFTAPTRSPRS
jgi:hypothetical protein